MFQLIAEKLTVTAGTELAVAYSAGTVSFAAINCNIFFPAKRGLRTEILHPSRGVA